jgi:hypothetical protein
MEDDRPRMILALASEADDGFAMWDQLKTLQPGMFAAGPVAIKFAYFGAEGALQVRPYIATRWVADADAMADIMDRGRANCVCGCYVEVNDILETALQETRQGPVQAVVIIGDYFHGDLDSAIAVAKQLRAVGTKIFVLQSGVDRSNGYRALAEQVGGALFKFNPHVERVAKRLPGLLKGITHFAVGGVAALEALEAQGDEPAGLLLEQIDAKRSRLGPPK